MLQGKRRGVWWIRQHCRAAVVARTLRGKGVSSAPNGSNAASPVSMASTAPLASAASGFAGGGVKVRSITPHTRYGLAGRGKGGGWVLLGGGLWPGVWVVRLGGRHGGRWTGREDWQTK